MTETMPGPRFQSIQRQLTAALKPSLLEIKDDSWKHASHAAMKGLSVQETHFSIKIVSPCFENKSLLQRHRMVQNLLQEEFKSGLHALSLSTLTSGEVDQRGKE